MAWAYIAGAQTINGTVVNKPTGTLSGHTLICVQSYANATATGSAPSGFVEVTAAAIQNVAASNTFRIWWKAAGGAEPTTYTFTNSAAVYQDLALFAYSGLAAAPVDAGNSAAYASVTTTGATLPVVTTTAAGDLLLAAISGPTASLWTPTAPLVTRVAGNWDGNDIVDTTITSAGSSGTLVDKPNATQTNVIASVATFTVAGGTTAVLAATGAAQATGSALRLIETNTLAATGAATAIGSATRIIEPQALAASGAALANGTASGPNQTQPLAATGAAQATGGAAFATTNAILAALGAAQATASASGLRLTAALVAQGLGQAGAAVDLTTQVYLYPYARSYAGGFTQTGATPTPGGVGTTIIPGGRRG